MSDRTPAIRQPAVAIPASLIDDPSEIRAYSDADFRVFASELTSWARVGMKQMKTLIGMALAEAWHRWGDSKDYDTLFDAYKQVTEVDRKTLQRWREKAARDALADRMSPKPKAIPPSPIETISVRPDLIVNPSAAVPTTVSERGPDAGEEFVPLPGSGQPQEAPDAERNRHLSPKEASEGSTPSGGAAGGVSATSDGVEESGTKPTCDPALATASTPPAPSPPVQTPECGPQGASAVKGSELVEQPGGGALDAATGPDGRVSSTTTSPEVAELEGVSQPARTSTTSGSSRSVGAAGRSTSARPAEPSDDDPDLPAYPMLPFVRKVVRWLTARGADFLVKLTNDELTGLLAEVENALAQKIGPPKSSNGNGSRPFAGPIPKVGKK